MASFIKSEKSGGCFLHTWTLTSADGTGDAIEFPGASDRSIQAFGTWGNATLVLEGSNEASPTTWFALTDPQGNTIQKTADGGEAVMENVLWIRPRLSVTGSGASLTVLLLSRGTR